MDSTDYTDFTAWYTAVQQWHDALSASVTDEGK